MLVKLVLPSCLASLKEDGLIFIYALLFSATEDFYLQLESQE